MAYKPIAQYGLIGNMHTAALVGVDGSIDWCCLPRFDSPSVFAAIIDDDKGGTFRIGPRMSLRSHQAYIPNTNVLETTFQTDKGAASLVDFMPCYGTRRLKLKQYHEIHRIVRCLDGEVPLELLFEPRLDYARGDTVLTASKHGCAVTGTGPNLALCSEVPLSIAGGSAAAIFTLRQGESARFVLRCDALRPGAPGVYTPRSKLEKTLDYWKKKAEGCIFSGKGPEAVVRSYLALHLLLYARTGAIVAAPTTSLPEEIGGERNWDYRFAWLRDASLTLQALLHLGHRDEALGFFNWLISLCGKCGPKAQILYNIDFENPLGEQEMDHLSGYRGSRPVRIGNDAHRQLQLDVFGEVLDAAFTFLNTGGYISKPTWELLESFVDAACDTWHRPDSGIWEVRSGPYHFVHSKLMCWVAIDRGIKIAGQLGDTRNIERWSKVAQEIREDMLRRGWKEDRQAFVQHYDTSGLDSSNLLLSLYGFLPVTDPRMRSTVERTMEELSSNGLLRRYRTMETDDGLKGSEGAFLWCSFWLVRNLAAMGRLEEASSLYAKLVGYANHLGLISEMVDPSTGELLGNFPQALTHLAVITTGLELSRSGEGTVRPIPDAGP